MLGTVTAMARHIPPLNQLLHLLLAAGAGVGAGGCAWELTSDASPSLHIVVTTGAALVAAAVAWYLSWSPERVTGQPLDTALEREDMRYLTPRAGIVFVASVVLLAAWLRLAL